MAVRRSLSEFLHGLNADAVINGVNRLDVVCSVRIECKNSTLGAEISTFSRVQKGAGPPFPTTVITNTQTIFRSDHGNPSIAGNFGTPCTLLY